MGGMATARPLAHTGCQGCVHGRPLRALHTVAMHGRRKLKALCQMLRIELRNQRGDKTFPYVGRPCCAPTQSPARIVTWLGDTGRVASPL